MAISVDAPGTAELEGVMTGALVSMDIAAGIAIACVALGDSEEPSMR